MSKRCSRCGKKLDKKTGLCPSCGRTGRPGGGSSIHGAKDAAGEALDILKKQKHGRPGFSGGRGLKKRIVTFVAVLLAVSILIFTGLGVLAYFDKAELKGYDKIFGKMGIQRKTEETLGEFNSEAGQFTDVIIKDDESAISAAKDAVKMLGLTNAGDDLTVENVSSNNGLTYYRIQQNYKGIPVYGRTINIVADKSGVSKGFSSNVEDIEVSTTDADLDNTDFKAPVEDYLLNTEKISSLKNFEVITPDKSDLVIYKHQGADNAVLACRITVTYESETGNGSAELIFDLENGRVITKCEMISAGSAVCYGPSADSGTYVMDDTDRNIYVFNAGRNIFFDMYYGDSIYSENAAIVESSDEYFGNEDDNGLYYDKAYDVLSFLQKCYDFYDNGFNCQSYGNFIVVYNDDLNLSGDNAAGGSCTINMLGLDSPYFTVPYDSEMGFMDIGYRYSDDISSNVDVLAHEYSHVVTRYIVNWGSSQITAAVNEGISDIFGEILQSKITGTDPDWSICGRPIYDPSENGYPENINSEENGREDYSHGHSTCVSHAAYLMTTGVGGKYTALSLDELSQLWYSALWLMPSDCDYNALRQALTVAADVIGLSEDKQECISAALESVGIMSDSGETYSNDINLSVYGINGELYNNYTVSVTGQVYSGALKTGIIKKDYTNTITVNDSSEAKLNLERGDYEITITDNSDSALTLTKEFKVRASSSKTDMVFRTGSGSDYTIGKDTLLQVYDVNNLAYDNYRVDITGTFEDGEDYTTQITVSDSKPVSLGLLPGTYTCTVTDLEPQGKTVTFTVRVTESGGVETLNIETGFGEAKGKPDQDSVPYGAGTNNGHYYYVYSTDGYSNYNEVKEFCESVGGYPVTISSAAENRFVRSLVKISVYSSAATGLANKNGWGWTNGEAFTFKNWKTDSESGDCAAVSASDGKWSGSSFGKCEAFVCEWGEYTPAGTPVIQSPNDREPSADNDTVIILDVSDSINTNDFKKLADSVTQLASDLVGSGSSVAVVTYDGEAKTVSELTKNTDQLEDLIYGIGKGEVSYSGCLKKAEKILTGSSAETKDIIFITNSGDSAGSVIKDVSSDVKSLEKSGINVYTLGIFGKLGNKDRIKAISQLDRISGENRHYEAQSFDDAYSYLKNIFGQISGGSYMCLTIKGPVDIDVESDDQSLSTGGSDEKLVCDMGTVSLIDTGDSKTDRKIVRLLNNNDYKVNMTGSESGTVQLRIAFTDSCGNFNDVRSFDDISVKKGTIITVKPKQRYSITLDVDYNGNGRTDSRYKALAGSEAKKVSFVLVYIGAAAVIIFVLVILFLILFGDKIKRRRSLNSHIGY